MRLHRLLSRLFALEQINGRELCPTYLYRWTLWKGRDGSGLYLHKFVGDDWSLDLHDHPKRFVSIGLWGRYVEERQVPCLVFDSYHQDAWIPGTRTVKVRYRAPWIRTFPATHVHRLTGPTPERPCWTLVYVGRPVREWGFWHLGEFIPWKRYVFSKTAETRKACP